MKDPEQIEAVTREVLEQWPIYSAGDRVQVTFLDRGFALQYCSLFAGRPFTSAMRIAPDPPNYFSANVLGDTFYLVFIQIERQHRGKGLGEKLYDAIVQLAGRFGCKEVRQTPSGGWNEQTREAYLVKRGWEMEEDEAVKPTQRDSDG